MAPQGPGRFGKSVNAWLFKASCDSGTHSVEIRVHDAFTESEAASAAEKYGKDIGRLPKVLRTGIKPAKGFQILSIHKGNYSWSASSSDGRVNIYTGFGWDGHDEEVLFHEATHVSLDKRIEPDGAWEAAQKADRAFISHHAENLPSREDVAESFLAYFSARFVRSRITKKWEKTIYETIPNRIAYFDALLSANDMTPFTKASPRVAGLVIKYDSLAIEASNTATYDIRLFSPPDAAVTVTPASDDAAVATVSGPLTFTTGNWHIPQTVTVTGTGPGTATISHTSSSNYAATALPVPVTVLQTVSLSVSGNGAVDEGDPALTVTATLRAANATGQALAIPVQARAAGTTATSADYTLAGTISIAAGAISGTTDLAVVDDGNDELEETLVIELGSPLPSGLAAGEMDHVTITISDNDVTTVTLTTPDTTAAERNAADTAQIALTLERGLVDGELLGVPLQFSGGAAGTLFTLTCPNPLPAGVICQTLDSTPQVFFRGPDSGVSATAVTLSFAARDDADSDNETVTVSIPASSSGNGPVLMARGLVGGATGARTGDGQITITDNNASAVSLSVSGNGAVDEGDPALTITAVLDTANATGQALAIPVQVRAAGTTASSADYTLTGTISIADGATSGTADLSVVDDGDVEDVETVLVELGSPLPSGLSAGTTDHVTIGIGDNDAPANACLTGTVLADVQDYAKETGNGNAHVTRWKQVLAGFGARNGETPMDAATAQDHADDFQAVRWNPVVTALQCLENAANAEPGITVAGGSSVTEGGDVMFTVTADPTPSSDLDVTLNMEDDAASDFLDPGKEGAHTVTVPANQPSATLTLSTTGDTADEANGIVTATVQTGTGYTVASAPDDTATVAVTDDDATTVTLTVPDATATEDDAEDTAEIVLTLGRGLVDGESLAAPLQFAGGAAGTDFTLTCPDPLPAGVTCQALDSAPQVTFTGPASGAGATAVTLSFAALDDADSDGETVTVSIPASSTGNAPVLAATGLGGGAAGSRTGNGEIAISDDDPATCATASLRPAIEGYIAEQADGTPHVTRWKQVLAAFGDRNGHSKMTASQAEQNADDFLAARWNPVVTVLQCLEKAGAGTTNTEPGITVSGGSAITEGGDAVFTVTADPAPTADLDVTLNMEDDAASDFLDSGKEGAHTVTVPANQPSATLTISTTGDTADEANGSVTATVQTGTGYTVASAPDDTATVAVTDDDATTVTLTVPDTTATEDDAEDTAEIVLTLGRGLVDGESLAAPLQFAGGAAGTDFTLTCPDPLPAGVTCQALDSAPQVTFTGPDSGAGATAVTLSFAALDDADSDGETVTVSIPASSTGNAPVLAATGLGGGAAGSRTGNGEIAIADDDAPTVNAYAALIARMYEWRNDPRWKSHKAHTDRWDRALLAFGESVADGTLTPMTADEAQAFADRGWTRWVEVAKALHEIESAGTAGTNTEPGITVAGGSAVTEGGDAVFTVTADPAPTADLDVTLDVSDDAAGDFLAQGDEGTHTVTVPANQPSATLTLATVNDNADEPDGNVSATVASGAGYTVGSPDTATVAVSDDDATPTLSVGISPESANEGDAGSAWATVTFGLDPVRAQPTAFRACLGNAGTATRGAGGDYRFVDSGNGTPLTLTGECHDHTLAANTARGEVRLMILGDTAFEPDETVVVELRDPPQGVAVSGTRGSATLTIVNDDAAPGPELGISAGPDVDEGGNAMFTVHADPAPRSDLTVELAVAWTGEYLGAPAPANRQLTLAAGAASATLSLPTINDGVDEPDGSITATLQAGTGYTVADEPDDAASIAVSDNDATTVTLTTPDATAAEGDAADTAEIVLTLGRGLVDGESLAAPLQFTGGAAGTHFTLTCPDPLPAGVTCQDLDSDPQVTFTGPESGAGATEVTLSLGAREDADSDGETVTVSIPASSTGNAPVLTATGLGGGAAGVRTGDGKIVIADDDVSATPKGPSLSVNDVEVQEGPYRRVWFTVTLSEAVEKYVSFYYRVRESDPVSAKRGVDFWASTGKTFAGMRPGQTEYRIRVAMVIDDSHDEDPETFEIVLSDANGAAIADGVGVATIVNDDPMPAAWLGRFGRTVAQQALDGISDRMAAERTPGVTGTLAGYIDLGSLLGFPGSGSGGPEGSGVEDRNGLRTESGSGIGSGNGWGLEETGWSRREITVREAMLGSSFTATGREDAMGGSLSFWGRGSESSFDGREGTFSLDGDATTAMLGADYARDGWLLGLALVQSDGEGSYADTGSESVRCQQPLDGDGRRVLCGGAVREGDGQVESTLTSVVPYGSLRASDRIGLWGAFGHGTGEVFLRPDTMASGDALEADITWTMASMGMRGDLLRRREGNGPALALTADALWARTESDRTRELAGSDSDATRLRLGLEGSWQVALSGGGHLTPKLELGIRHDGGDAETGSGIELGAGVSWSSPATGIRLDLSGRTLVSHDDDDLEDRGFSADLSFDPDGNTKRGPSFSLRQELGGQSEGGLDALFADGPLSGRAGNTSDGDEENRWTMEAAYGFPAFSGRYTGSPHAGMGIAGDTRDYSVGWRLAPESGSAADLSFGVRATRRESLDTVSENIFGFEASLRW